MSEYLFVDGKRIGIDKFTPEIAKTAKQVEARNCPGLDQAKKTA